MTLKPKMSSPAFVDTDEAPAWTEDQIARAEFAVGGKVIRPADGTLSRARGRPRLANVKQVVSIRLEPEVIEAYRRTGPGWQARMGEVLRKALAQG